MIIINIPLKMDISRIIIMKEHILQIKIINKMKNMILVIIQKKKDMVQEIIKDMVQEIVKDMDQEIIKDIILEIIRDMDQEIIRDMELEISKRIIRHNSSQIFLKKFNIRRIIV